jgi:arginase
MKMRSVAVLDAPSNLGLRPPEGGAVPGCYKLPWALREAGLVRALGAYEAGCVVPPRYISTWSPGGGTRNAEAIASYSLELADRIELLLTAEHRLLVLGGDCSILIGSMLALRRRGRYGLVFLDAHSDFRHPGNSAEIGAAAGEDLAIVLGYGDPRLTALGAGAPLVQVGDVVLAGIRAADPYLQELAPQVGAVLSSSRIEENPIGAAEAILRALEGTEGFWIHLDADVLDPVQMPAVDAPALNGISLTALGRLLGGLVRSPALVGMELTIFDPDLDPTGDHASALVGCIGGSFV